MINDEAFPFFSDTVGVCMKSDLPSCLSHRERLFIVNTMVKDFKEIFAAMEELIGYQYNINVSGKITCRIQMKPIKFNDFLPCFDDVAVCSIWSSELLFPDSKTESSGAEAASNCQGLVTSFLLFVFFVLIK